MVLYTCSWRQFRKFLIPVFDQHGATALFNFQSLQIFNWTKNINHLSLSDETPREEPVQMAKLIQAESVEIRLAYFQLLVNQILFWNAFIFYAN